MTTDNLFKELRKTEPEAHVAYFPNGDFYVVHVWGRMLSGEHGSRDEAIREALERLSSKESS